LLACLAAASAFVPAPVAKARLAPLQAEKTFVETVQTAIRIFQESTSQGADFKQAVADALAGEYDRAAAQATLDDYVASAPCVVFTWKPSPFSQKALKYLDVAGADVKNVRLDDPWAEGNPLRAELGRMVGRTSVPSVFIGGKYVGGFDGGVSEDQPGILDLAFQGKLRPLLEDAGALK
jgi:glutaredoxin 3